MGEAEQVILGGVLGLISIVIIWLWVITHQEDEYDRDYGIELDRETSGSDDKGVRFRR
jgi:hypothetical protein